VLLFGSADAVPLALEQFRLPLEVNKARSYSAHGFFKC